MSKSGEPIISKAKDYHDLSTAMWRIRQSRKAELNINFIDDKWKDRLLLGTMFLVRLASCSNDRDTKPSVILN